jgi:hypothetical protein
MNLITTKQQIETNLETLEQYLANGSGSEKGEVQKLIGKGRCLVAYKREKVWHFAPSRFIGYINNTLKQHFANSEKNGRDTNPAIERVLNKKFSPDSEMEELYVHYCGQIGAKASAYSKRKYLKFV